MTPEQIADTIRNWAHREDVYVPRADELAACIYREFTPVDIPTPEPAVDRPCARWRSFEDHPAHQYTMVGIHRLFVCPGIPEREFFD